MSYTLSPKDVERFWSKVNIGTEQACWLWQGGGTQPYGHFSVGPRASAKTLLAHRVAYELSHGRTNLNVCHICDTPRCCNPSHLFAGTQQDNRQDCATKERTAKGESHGKAVLTAASAKRIVRLRSNGMTLAAIASLLSVGETTVQHVLSGRTWSHVTGITKRN